jgi:hypothetical protein
MFETISLAPNESKSLRYVADPAKSTGSATFLKVEAKYEDVKSILDIRFIRDGFDEVRLNYPGLTKYPVSAGEQNTLFSCFHATNKAVVSGGELNLTLTDSFGTVLDTYTYQGDITGDMMGVKHDFTPKTAASTYTLKADLKKDGKTVETYEALYDCNDFDPALCSLNVRPTVAATTGDGTTTGKVLLSSAPYAVLALVVIGLVSWFLIRKRNGLSIFVFVLLGSSLLFAPYGAEAKSAQWNAVTNTMLYRRMILGEALTIPVLRSGERSRSVWKGESSLQATEHPRCGCTRATPIR